MPAYAYILSADVGIHGHQVRKFYGKGDYIMTLKEFADVIVVDAEIVDIYVWDEEKYDYIETLGFDPSTGDLGADLEKLSAEDQQYLSWEVHYIMPLHHDGKDILRIEIQKGEN